jgi:hypothetical protein
MPDVNAQMTAVRRKAPIINSRALIRDLAAWQQEVASRVIVKLKEYPPELDNQRYVRTFKLGSSWRASQSSFTSAGMTLSITNFVVDRRGKRYASFVQGLDQRPIHEGRWLRVNDAMQEENTEYRRGIKSILRSHGLT